LDSLLYGQTYSPETEAIKNIWIIPIYIKANIKKRMDSGGVRIG
jgi:hypothetical protein